MMMIKNDDDIKDIKTIHFINDIALDVVTIN